MSSVLDRYETGPDAVARAQATARRSLDTATAVVLVEGVTDQIAVDAAAEVLGHDLGEQGVVVLPIGGAHAVGAVVRTFASERPDVAIAGLCDVREEPYFRTAFRAVSSQRRHFACVVDLEDELFRACGRALTERVLDAEADTKRFAKLCAQPAWVGASFDVQVRRFIRASGRRNHRYASALTRALPADRIPAPLRDVLALVVTPARR